MTNEKNSLALLSNASKMLAEIKTIDDAKNLMDTAAAVKLYAQKHKLGKEAVGHAHEIEIRAEKKLGEMLEVMEKNKGAMGIGTSVVNQDDRTPTTLAEIGITKNLSSEAQTLAQIEEDVFEKVATGKKSKQAAVKEVKQKKRNAKLKEKSTELPAEIFQVIYCDPPWQYSNSGFEMSAENKYPTMSIDELRKLRVNEISDTHCAMFMWATNPLLKDALSLMTTWGFEYKTNLVWVKNRHTAGFYTFGQHELLLIGTKGSMLPVEKPTSIITGDNNIHSRKPEIVYDIINTMYPGLKKVELFARKGQKGFTPWGNEL